MKLEKDVDLSIIAAKCEGFSGAEIKALTTEAGYLAIKNDRKKISQKDLLDAVEIIALEEENYEMLNHSFS
jgi:ATP-dependent 26S proteasome regulatory subunit